MIREMKASDWDEMAIIYKQSLENGNVTFRTKCPSYREWNESHIKDCGFVYKMDGKLIGDTMITPTSSGDSYRGVVEVSIFVYENYTKQGIGTRERIEIWEPGVQVLQEMIQQWIYAVNTPVLFIITEQMRL